MQHYYLTLLLLATVTFSVRISCQVEPTNQFLVTISGTNMSAAQALRKLQTLVTSIKGQAFDIDECEVMRGICAKNTTCMNTLGSFLCLCNPEFSIHENATTSCTDEYVNECLVQTQNCSDHATCVNDIGSFACVCKPGFSGDGYYCYDIDECLTSSFNRCHEKSKCTNTLGSYRCVCGHGYKGDGCDCTDVDECEENNSSCHSAAICTNTAGGYVCNCASGYVGDGKNCSLVPATQTDHCALETNECHSLAICINQMSSYSCLCNETTYDNNTQGRLCVSPVEVKCTATSIRVKVIADYFQQKSINLDDLHLLNYNCRGKQSKISSLFWIFLIQDLSSCSTVVKKNRTHVTYSNILSNSVEKGVFLGTTISVPFSCSYFSNITVALPMPYIPRANIISIAGPSGNGTFVVEMNIFTDSSYKRVSNETVFATTDIIYIQVKLTSEDENLILFLHSCWATPSNAGSDPFSYHFIEGGCPIPEKVAGTVKITTNGIGKMARFQSQVFGFVDFNSTYLHCTVDLCSLHNGQTCTKKCDESNQKTKSLVRKKRENKDDVLSLGPFVKETNANELSKDTYWNTHALSIYGFSTVLVILFIIVLYTIINLRRSRRYVEQVIRNQFGNKKEDNSSSMRDSNQTSIDSVKMYSIEANSAALSKLPDEVDLSQTDNTNL